MEADVADVAVLKFGGSAFIELSDYRRVAGYLTDRIAETGTRVLVVVSGMSGTTGRLLEAAESIDPALQPEVQDQILATAEMVSASFLRAALAWRGCQAIDLWAPQIGIHSTGQATRAQITGIDPEPVREALSRHPVVVVAGGQAVRPDGRITMLGRNSSDLTAVALAAMLGAGSCEIFSDVPGVYSADPYIVPMAALMPSISYAQCAAMSASGAKVLHGGSVLAASSTGLTITCRTLSADHGAAEAVTGTVVGTVSSQSDAVVGTSRVQLARLRHAQMAEAGVAAAALAGLTAVQVRDADGVVLAVAGAAIGLDDVLGKAEIDATAIAGLGLVSVISPAGHADRELVPLAEVNDRVRELHCAAGLARADQAAFQPAVRKSPHSGLLAGERR